MSMERLTDKIITKACNDPWDLCELDSVCKRDCYKPTPCKIPHVVYRLAQIEDIIGDTYDLYRIRELVEADKDGRCFVSDTKIGCEVFYIPKFNGKPYCGVKSGHVQAVAFTKAGKRVKIREYHAHNQDFMIGKSVFLTREAAEAALAKEADHE